MTGETPQPKYQVGDTVTLKSGTLHRIYSVYEFKPDRGYRYSTMTVRADGTPYGPWRNITDKTPTVVDPVQAARRGGA